MVQVRRNGWDLVGDDGNTRAPINRETYQVVRTHADAAGCGWSTRPGRDHPAPGVSRRARRSPTPALCTPPRGKPVNTAHAVIDAAAAYLALTRGRERNTAHVVTRVVAADAESGQTHEVEPRTPGDVLGDVLASGADDAGAD